jgi:hypothetical protein
LDSTIASKTGLGEFVDSEDLQNISNRISRFKRTSPHLSLKERSELTDISDEIQFLIKQNEMRDGFFYHQLFGFILAVGILVWMAIQGKI